MRIVAGSWAGQSLVSPAGRVRPTAEAVRTLCMEMLDDELAGSSLLDLFAGTGALGLEALSRGALTCDFVENHPSALHSLKANVTKLGARPRSRIFKQDAIPFVERLPEGQYDIAFADPPYGSRKLDRVMARWIEVPFSRILVIEHERAQRPALRGDTRHIEDMAITVVRQRRRAKQRQIRE